MHVVHVIQVAYSKDIPILNHLQYAKQRGESLGCMWLRQVDRG